VNPGLGVIGLSDPKDNTPPNSGTRTDSAALETERTRDVWRRCPEKIVIIAASSLEDLKNAAAWRMQTHPFVPSASRDQIASQQNKILVEFWTGGPVVWGAYWPDGMDCIWVVGIPGAEGGLPELYAHLRAEIASTETAKSQAWKKNQPATIARAKFVEKVLNELKTIHSKMHNESCFEQVAANHSEFSSFKIARTDADVKLWIENIQERRDLVKLAQEIAARRFRKSKDTLATDWSHRKKPRKKAMK
jgi:DNA-binding transcriptional regulator YiaG